MIGWRMYGKGWYGFAVAPKTLELEISQKADFTGVALLARRDEDRARAASASSWGFCAGAFAAFCTIYAGSWQCILNLNYEIASPVWHDVVDVTGPMRPQQAK